MLLPVIFATCLLLVAVQAIRRPMLRRLAIRDAVRRPGETALVIAGSLLGTALITGSFIVGDTLDSSIKATAYTKLGPVDEVVTTPTERIAARIVENLRAVDDPDIDGVTSLVTADGAFTSKASGKRRAEPDGQIIELDFDAAEEFGSDPAVGGIRGATPDEGEVVITQDLADEIRVAAGDDLTAFLYGDKLELRVDRVIPTVGVAGFSLDFGTRSPNGFVAPGTLDALDTKELPPGVVPPSSIVIVSNRGGVEEGAALTDDVTDVIEEAFPEGAALRVEEVKKDTLDAAEVQGDAFSEIFVSIGAFAIIAGVLLLVNIFVMLSEERKSQLGMLRAVGMRRGYLVRTFVIEGAMYSLISSALGAVLGIGVGWAIVKLAAPIFAGFGDFSLDLLFDFESDSIVTGFCAGGLISLLTVFFTSFRISRVNIIRAIRDLPEPRAERARLATVLLGAGFSLSSLAAFIVTLGNEDAWVVAILGPPFALLGLLPLASRFVPRRTAVLFVAALSLFWGIFGNGILDEQFFEGGEIFAFVVQGVLLTFSAVMLLTQAQETLEGGIRRVAARRLPLRLSIAYPLAHRFRTGLTLGMFALVIFTMTFIATLSNVFGGQVETAAAKEGGFEILVTSNTTNPPPPNELAEIDGVESVTTLLSGFALFTAEEFPEPEPWPASGVDASFVEGGPPSLGERAEEYESDRAVWEALVDDPTKVVIPSFLFQEGGGPPSALIEPGDELNVTNPVSGERVTRTVAGVVENDVAFSGVYMPKSAMREVVGRRAAAARFYVETSEDPREASRVADDIQARFVANGVEARTFRSLVEENQQISLQFFRLMQGYLALGLLIGIAGLGVVMVRAVRERRREVGVLRSLGFMVRQIRRAFVLESGFVAFEGILIGAALALVTAAQLIATGEFGENIAFIIPWPNLSILTLGSLVASLLATAWPAQQASQIPPAAALRIAD
ncbi:MAG: FtsX-like permease family protein [Actinomycetota bacterium]